MPEEGFNLDDFDLDISSTSSVNLISSSPQKIISKVPTTIEEEKQFVQQIFSRLEKNLDRVEIILTNLHHSKFFKAGSEDFEFKDTILHFEREFEESGKKELEKLKTFFRDFFTAPRAVSSYSNRYTQIRKEKLRLKSSEAEKYQLIFEWEMQEKFLDYLKHLGKLMIEIMNLINQKSSSSTLKVLDYRTQQTLEDVKTSSLFAMGEIDNIRKDIEKWKTAVSNG